MGYKEKDKVRVRTLEFIIKNSKLEQDTGRYYAPDGFWMSTDDEDLCGQEFEILKVVKMKRGGTLYILDKIEGRLFSTFFIEQQKKPKFEFKNLIIEF